VRRLRWLMAYLRKALGASGGRALLSAGCTALAVAVVLLSAGLYLGLREQLARELRAYGANAILSPRSGQYLDVQAVRQALAQEEGVLQAHWQLYGRVLLINAVSSGRQRLFSPPQELELIGLEPEKLQGYRLKGMLPQGGQVAVGEALAEADYLIERIGELLKVLYAYEPMMERRRAPRYEVPQEYHQLIRLGIQTEGGALPALLLDLSEGGVRLQCPRAFAPGSQLALELSAPRCLHHNATFSMEVRHCQELSPGAYVLGGAVLRKDQEMWFRVYQRMFEFIIRRKGILY